MTTKQWLSRFKNTDIEIRSLREQKEIIFSELTKCTSVTDEERFDGTKENTREKKLVKYTELSSTIDDRIVELMDICVEINKAIQSVPDGVCRTILYERYIKFKSWHQIAAIIHYSDKYIIQVLHPKALRAIKR